MSVTTNHVFLAFSELVDRSRSWMSARFVDACGISKEILLERMAQRVVEGALPAYAQRVHDRLAGGQTPFPSPGDAVDFGDARIHVGSGGLTVGFAGVLRAEREFVVHWAYVLFTIIAGWWSGRRTCAAVLVYDLSTDDVWSDGSDARFVEFCRQGPVTPLRDGQRRYVEASGTMVSTAPDAFIYCRHPLVELIRNADMSAGDRLTMLLGHLVAFWTCHLAMARMPTLTLVAKELAYGAAASTLDARGFITAVVMTCSSYRRQPVWTRTLRAPTHMVWYSQNWATVVRVSGDVRSDYPTTRWIRADVHWVWTHAFARYLGSLVTGEMRVVGPLLWRLPERMTPDPSMVSIAVFDVTAVTDEAMLRLNGELTNYICPANLKAFVTDVVAMRSSLEENLGVPVALSLKMKREFRADYAREYFDFVEASASRGEISQPQRGQSLFEMISRSDLAVVYPHTSPAYVAEYLGVPAIFYDPTRSIVRGDFADRMERVHFASGPLELRRLVLGSLHDRVAAVPS